MVYLIPVIGFGTLAIGVSGLTYGVINYLVKGRKENYKRLLEIVREEQREEATNQDRAVPYNTIDTHLKK
nr:hypothetical protein [Nanoarchaeota archaeon]